MERICLPLLISALGLALPSVERSSAPVNDRPIIGILTQEVSDEAMRAFGQTYIPASYVKYIESAGSRVVPIRLNRTREEYEKMFAEINGLLFIGGAVDLLESDYARTARLFYKLAVKANDEGDFFPIWGTCMGFQLLTVLVAGEDLLSNTTAENIAMPLNLTADAASSRMFRSFPPDLFAALSKEPITGNFHHYGITQEVFLSSSKLNGFFSVLSTNVAQNGVTFISTMEGRRYPFYGVQWHPEVNRFQWNPKYRFPHTPNAVRLSSLLADLFINEARKSEHHYRNLEEEKSALIYNYTPVDAREFTGYQQIYFF